MHLGCGDCLRDCPPGLSFCGRKDSSGKLIREFAFCAALIDRLFEKPVNFFSADIPLLSLGSWGCNFRCRGCQNAALSWTTDGAGLERVDLEPGAVVRMATENGCRGVAFTFNEPAVYLPAVAEVAAECRRAGLVTVLVTNSTLSVAAVQRIAPWINAVAADIKSFSDRFYCEYCGAEGISRVAAGVRECIGEFCRAGCHVEIRTNIIPGGNDDEEDLTAIAEWIQTHLGPRTPWHLTRFFPGHELIALQRTPTSILLRAQRIGIASGLKHVHAHYSKGCDCASKTAMIRVDGPGVLRVTRTCCG